MWYYRSDIHKKHSLMSQLLCKAVCTIIYSCRDHVDSIRTHTKTKRIWTLIPVVSLGDMSNYGHWVTFGQFMETYQSWCCDTQAWHVGTLTWEAKSLALTKMTTRLSCRIIGNVPKHNARNLMVQRNCFSCTQTPMHAKAAKYDSGPGSYLWTFAFRTSESRKDAST